MAARFIEGETGAKITAELTRLKNETPSSFAPFLYDITNGVLKYYDRVAAAVKQFATLTGVETLTNKTLTSPVITGVVTGPAPVSITGATQILTAAAHAGVTVVANRAAGIAFTLPAATGTGNKYRIIVGTTLTSGSLSVAVASGTDFMRGVAIFETDDAGNVPQTFPTANTGTVATESDTITFNRTTTGLGTIGDYIEIEDIAAAVFAVKVVTNANGTEATPFTVAV